MVKKFSALFLLMFMISGVLKAQVPPPPVLGPGEKYTTLYSVSYDYQTNGSVRYLVQDPTNAANWCAILMAQQDSNTAAGTGRYIYYAYSGDWGNTWSGGVLDISAAMGFPCMTLSNGLPVIAAHKSSALGSFVYRDIQFGGFGFENIGGIPLPTATPPIWPHAVGTSNNNIVLVGSPNPGFVGATSTYNGANWSNFVDIPMISGPSGNYEAAAGAGGKVALIGTDYNGTSALNWYRSNDNGVTWDGGATILPYIITGGDTLFMNIAGGFQAVYDNAGNAHIVFAAYNVTSNTFPNPNTVEYVNPSIYHWNSGSGTLTAVANKSRIPSLADTITTLLIEPLCMPTITISPSGRLSCAYTAYTQGNTQVVDNGDVLNCGEIYVQSSADNGVTWGSPVNLTNTPNVEEKHPSFCPATNTDSIRIYYVRDLKAGGWVNNAAWGKAPVYGIFKTNSPAPVGIKENVAVAKSFELFQNYPNPFNPTTTISYFVQKQGLVTMKVYDAMGREVATLVNEIQPQGAKEILFDASKLSSGIYYYSITAGDFKDTKKMMLIK